MLIFLVEACKCGSTDHLRTSAKACHLHTAPKSKRDRIEGIKERTCTIKIGFNRFLAEPALAPVINNAVKNMTYISFKACHLANTYILYLLNEGLPIPPLDCNSFMCFCHSKLLSRHSIVLIFQNKH